MLCQFSFKNFKSYRDETVFDFQAATLPEFTDTLIRMEKCGDLLPVGVVYGPNGGGKTNLLQALSCLISTVVKPIHDLEKNRLNVILQERVACVPTKTRLRNRPSFRYIFAQRKMSSATIWQS